MALVKEKENRYILTRFNDILFDWIDQFKIKRDQVEKTAEVNIENMSSEFKKVLGLLELQIKEYQMKMEVDDLIHMGKLTS